jgi:hypothetical protein
MKRLTQILIYLNPVGGLGLVACAFTGHWFYFLLILVALIGNTYLYLKYYTPTPEEMEFEEENEYLGEGYYSSIYRNKKTGKIYEC